MLATGFGASCFTTNESSQVLLVSVHNVLYPITEYVLHQVFDPYGYVEKIDIFQTIEVLQAIVQFDSCQNAVWAKSQLQGRYIYNQCCQLDIQFYKSFDNDSQTRNFLVENEFASDLEFIKNELQRMIVITDRMQDRIKAMNSLFQKTAHTLSKSSQSTNSISVISLTKPKVCNDSVVVVSTTSKIHINNGSVDNFENEQKCGRNLGFPGQVLEKFGSKTYLDLLLSYDDNTHNCKRRLMLKLIDLESAHIMFEGMRGLGVIPQHSHIVDVQVCGVLLSEHHPFKFYKENTENFSNRTSMNGSSEYSWKMLDNMCKHVVIVRYMKRDKSNSVLKIHGKVIGVFDPGGVYMTLYAAKEVDNIVVGGVSGICNNRSGELFSFADFFNLVLREVRSFGDVVHGCSLPIFLRFFADIINSFRSNYDGLDIVCCDVVNYAFYFLTIRAGIWASSWAKISYWIWTGERQTTKTIKYLESAINQYNCSFDTKVRISEVNSVAHFDAAFGIQWLQPIGLVTIDHKKVALAFNYNEQPSLLSSLKETESPTKNIFSPLQKLIHLQREQILELQFDHQTPLVVTIGIENKLQCENKIFIFDPGGIEIFNVKCFFHMRSIYCDASLIGSHLTTSRTRSIFERVVMMQHTHHLMLQRLACVLTFATC